MRKGEETRARILDIAQAAVLAKGFSSTSLDEIRAEAGLTKSGFLYHFSDKTALAKALLLRYVEDDEALFDDIFDRARTLHADPLHAFLIGLAMLGEAMADVPNKHPGCLVASVAYHDRQFNAEIRTINREAVSGWRARFHTMLEDAAEVHPPSVDVDLGELAEMLACLLEGGLVLARIYSDPARIKVQIGLYRTFVGQVFGVQA